MNSPVTLFIVMHLYHIILRNNNQPFFVKGLCINDFFDCFFLFAEENTQKNKKERLDKKRSILYNKKDVFFSGIL